MGDFILGVIVGYILALFLAAWAVADHLDMVKSPHQIKPIIEIHTVDGVSDTTYIYKLEDE